MNPGDLFVVKPGSWAEGKIGMIHSRTAEKTLSNLFINLSPKQLSNLDNLYYDVIIDNEMKTISIKWLKPLRNK